MKNLIHIDDARELRQLGLPILPVEDRTYSKAAEKLIVEAIRAKHKFGKAFQSYNGSATEQHFNRMQRGLSKLREIKDRAANFASSDEYEVVSLQISLTARIKAFLQFWEPILEGIRQGHDVEFEITEEVQHEWAFGI